jgi:hypothetical protein
MAHFSFIKAHGGKEIVLKEDFIQTDSDIYMLCFQLEESETGVSDQNLYEMTSLSASSILTGQALLCKNSSDKKVFLSGVLRLSPKMKRKGSFAVNLQATDQSLFPNSTFSCNFLLVQL